jgi:condensin complex subunit 2
VKATGKIVRIASLSILRSTILHLTVAGDGQIPFNTQFFHDDDDDFGDGFDGEPVSTAGADAADPSEQDLLAATAGQTRRVRPEFINYAKRAKRVDVRKLKDNIWKGLDILVPEADPNKMVRGL